jgi:hypothetical protein
VRRSATLTFTATTAVLLCWRAAAPLLRQPARPTSPSNSLVPAARAAAPPAAPAAPKFVLLPDVVSQKGAIV